MELTLVFSIDSGYEELAAIALCSVLLHNKIARVMVVTPKDCLLSRLPEIASSFSSELEQVHIRDNSPLHSLPPSVRPYFYCVEALELAPIPGRYLCIDADTLCVSNMTALEQLPLTADKPIASCSHGRPMPDRQLILDLKSSYHYFNAGVMLFDAEHLRACISCKEIVDFYQANPALCRFREQCALNALLKNRVQYLPLQYNYLSWMRERNATHTWHDQAANPMVNSLADARRNLVIAHLSAGALPDRLPNERLEPIDTYWLAIHKHLNIGKSPRDLPTYCSNPNN
ncbi:glycosyltransferase [Cyanobium sp. NS01]|uniref:glycosyltransferase family 8 protein n=1 Tax=Cyanobium sp. NS01 TaxID=261284 RepID=UPI001645145A|nr:glycosyltransferase [Cyanobium sp. NS01]QNI69373.1 glycosyltransferase/ family 8 [Cyanobium sp. NS01]